MAVPNPRPQAPPKAKGSATASPKPGYTPAWSEVSPDAETARARNRVNGTPSPANTAPKSGSPASGAGAAPAAVLPPLPPAAGGTPESQLPGLAPGAQLWSVGDKVYVVFLYPGTQVALGWHLTDLTQLEALGGTAKITKKITADQAQAQGFLHMGVRSSLVQFNQDPTPAFAAELDRQAKILPALTDPVIRQRSFAAMLEGRSLDEADLADTDYWKSRTEKQREWESWVLKQGGPTSPAVEQKYERGRIAVRDLFIKNGWTDVSSGLIDLWADRWVTGAIDEVQLADAVRRETDPMAPGASPFAGFNLPAGTQIVKHGTDTYARIGGRDWQLTGPGQVAKYVVGTPTEVSSVDDAGDLKQLAEQDTSVPVLGYESRVSDLLQRYLGPYYSKGYGDAWAAEWAGQYRQNPEVAEEMLKDTLLHAFEVAFPNYAGMGKTYADVAGVMKPEVARYYGSMDVPEDQEWFLRALQIPDAQERVKYLRKTGMKQGWAPVRDDFMEQAQSRVGGQVRSSIGAR